MLYSAMMTTPEISVLDVECKFCNDKMVVRHEVRPGPGAAYAENIVCLKCKREFPVNLPVGGWAF